MKILGIEHCTVMTPDIAATAASYQRVLGFVGGPRPAFAVRGAWLYQNDQPLVHIMEGRPEVGSAALEHVAFVATGLASCLDHLRRESVAFDLKRQPPPVQNWQIFLRDPNGVRLELNFAASETEEA
ncbi:MAG: hypothetical protein DI537_24440 [Stutzerimonas stutzeri]|nr:MAG: hypothetical protein DI537_24440 [Stutzerimonas stutzeri]